MQFEQAYSFLMPKLEQELPGHLYYHCPAHTREVVEAATHLGQAEGIQGDDLVLLQTAALFHDTGFLKGYRNHEELSCEMARESLPRFGYTPDQIEEVCRLIMATKLGHVPAGKMEGIICDADLHYLGTDRFFDNSQNLYRELKELGLVQHPKEWRGIQMNFLKNHRFYSRAAITEFSFKKGENFKKYKEQVRHKALSGISRWQSVLSDMFFIVLGIISAGFALKGFLTPNQFFDGGVTGISLLIHELYHFNLAYVIMLANLPLIIASYFTVSREFAFKTFACVVLLGLCLLYLPYPVITSDKLLISIFGGFFLGLGIGCTMRAGSALDGVEVLALYTLKRTSLTITEIILAINVLIFAIAALKFGLETALYSVLTYFTASRTIDFVIEGLEAYTGVTIISGKSELIKSRLVNELGRSITVYKGERGYLPGSFAVHSEVDIIFTVITRLELRRLKNLVQEVDPQAFVFASTIKDASGGVLKRRARH